MISVLDHGFVELVDSMGSDLTVVNAARVSFGARKEELGNDDERLIRYLAKNKHWSPFRHVQLQFHCKVPEAVARQWFKHCVGIAYSEGGSREIDHAWNEISGRYVDFSNVDFYVPEKCRVQSKDSKQASIEGECECIYDEYEGGLYAEEAIYLVQKRAIETYKSLIEAGVAKEQARLVLPLGFYTEFYWTASLQAVINFIKLRKHSHAQWEIQQYAEALECLVKEVVPVSFEELIKHVD